LLTYPEADLS